MHLADAFIHFALHIYITAFPGNQTHDLSIALGGRFTSANALLFELQHYIFACVNNHLLLETIKCSFWKTTLNKKNDPVQRSNVELQIVDLVWTSNMSRIGHGPMDPI